MPDSAPWVVGTALVVAGVAGAVGTVGPAATAGSVMAVIGVAYSQFGRLPMAWWQPAALYVVGSALLLAVALAAAPVHPQRHRREAVAAVLDGAAALLRAIGSPGADVARHRLALASATAREAMTCGRFGTVSRDPVGPCWAQAQEAAARAAHESAAARLTADTRDELARSYEGDADAVRAGVPPSRAGDPGPVPSLRRRIRAAAHRAVRRDAVLQGARSATCIGAATGLALLLHPPQHAYWIPLTVAMVLRPEYGSVLARSVHRLLGTVCGAALVAVLVVAAIGPVPLIVGAACALGLAVLANARLYGLAVVGITGSALLSIALSAPQDIEPWARLLDTVLGCAIAVVVGLLAWPARGLPDQHRALATTTTTLGAQVAAELDPVASTAIRAAARDDSYRQAHAWRAELERALAEPDPSHAAAGWLPVALAVERTVDALAAVGARLGDRTVSAPDVSALLDRIARIPPLVDTRGRARPSPRAPRGAPPPPRGRWTGIGVRGATLVTIAAPTGGTTRETNT